MRLLIRRAVPVLTLCLLTRAFAQTNEGGGTITGTVTDQSGNAIPNSSVIVKDKFGVTARVAKSEAQGRFTAPELAPGLYTVEISASGFANYRKEGVRITAGALEDLQARLQLADVSQTVTVEADVSVATNVAISQSSLDARSAQSRISSGFIENFASPVSDYTETLLMAPGTFSLSPNGVGLGDSKTYFRGFSDGQYTMTFDGIPFNDTNSPTHHSWAFFPAQWLGGTVFDRSPGSASTIGPTNFGGSINLLSREIQPQPDVRASISYGSFNTRLVDLSADSGRALGDKHSVTVDLHELRSDGYQTYNYQKRDAGSLKYQYRITPKTTLTVFGGILDLWTNTPNQKGPTRAQVAQFGDNYLLSGDPSRPDYFRFNYYHVATDFEYIDLNTELGKGWRLDSKAYTYRYWNKQNYNGTTITKTSATDKLNGYRKVGDVLTASQENRWGVFRTGAWYEWAYTDRYQVPSDPRTWINAALPNFHEKFLTQSLQPYGEFEFHATRKLSITAGVKLAYYNQHLNQFADNGKTVGLLGGVAFITHGVNYNNWLPSVDARYRLRNNWSVYGQFATGSIIPPSNVFDVKNASVKVLPTPTTTRTYQAGTVYKANRFTIDFDGYYTHFENPYSSTPDPVTAEPVYYLTGTSTTKGVEAESTIAAIAGISFYLNGTVGSAKYNTNHLWVQNAPHDTETIGLTYQRRAWDLGFFHKRIGTFYQDNGGTNQAVKIDPFFITNLFLNYTVKGDSYLRGTKFRFGINNLLDRHSIVGVTPASTATSVSAPGDILTLLPARSFSVTATFGYAPRR